MAVDPTSALNRCKDALKAFQNLETVYLSYTTEPTDEEGSFGVSISMTPKTDVDAAEQIERFYTHEIARN